MKETSSVLQFRNRHLMPFYEFSLCFQSDKVLSKYYKKTKSIFGSNDTKLAVKKKLRYLESEASQFMKHQIRFRFERVNLRRADKRKNTCKPWDQLR